jgi:hypothetical protein
LATPGLVYPGKEFTLTPSSSKASKKVRKKSSRKGKKKAGKRGGKKGKKSSTKAGKFSAETILEIGNDGGTETNELHTSCSKPLEVGDVFGSLTLVGINGERGGDAATAFSYEVTNHSTALESVKVMDNQLGMIAEGVFLEAGETRMFTAEAIVSGHVTSQVTVSGQRAAGGTCEAATTVEVR